MRRLADNVPMKKQGTVVKWAAPDRSRGRAIARRPAGRSVSPANSGAIVALPLMAAYISAVAWGVWTQRLPWWVLPALFCLSLFTFFAYWQDKFAAGKGTWRISESTLHTWSLAGGWPGAWFAQQVLRHKSTKQSFRATYWGTVVVNCAAVGGLLWWLRV
jgi:uncharacterized membrane protein YsdA (DUF1294 family)